MAGVLLPLALAASVLLPAAPRAVAVGDLEGDGSPEIVVLLAWPRWGSAMRDVATEPGMAEFEVVPAVEERREIRAFRREGNRLVPAARPLRVGPEVLALGAGGPAEPVLALVDEGVARLALVPPAGEGGEAALRLAPVAKVPHLLAGTGSVHSLFPLVREMDGHPPAEAIVPAADGFVLVHPDGSRARMPAPVVRTDGDTGRLAVPFPVPLGDEATGNLVAWLPGIVTRWERAPVLGRVALLRLPAALDREEARTWDLDPLLVPLLFGERREGHEDSGLVLAGVADWDRDGTLEVAIAHRRMLVSSAREALRMLRGGPVRFTFHRLPAGGPVETVPEWTLETTGLDYPFLEAGPQSPFADLDGDGVPELVTIDLGIGWFGVGRALVTGKGKAFVRPHVFRFAGDGFREVASAVPQLVGKMDIRAGELRRFARWPGDLDGDGIRELIEVVDDELRIRYGRPGPRWPERPDERVRLAGPLRRWLGLRLVELDGAPPRELLLLEDVPGATGKKDDEELAEPVLLEIVTPAGRREEAR